MIDVWIDPGHGGGDPGAPGFNGATLPDEKQLNIGVATYLEGDLTAFAYVVRKTQNSDSTYFTLTQRRRIAKGELENDLGFRDSCRLFISTHIRGVRSR